jgi:hypothetical protein
LVRANHALQPYVIFPYKENLKYSIGLRFLKGSTNSIRANNDQKGALRSLDVSFLANLVLTKKEKIQIVDRVKVNINDNSVANIS